MSHPRLPLHVRTIRSFLLRIGAMITKLRPGPRIVIAWRLNGKHHETSLARHVADPVAYAIGKMGEIKIQVGLAGAAA